MKRRGFIQTLFAFVTGTYVSQSANVEGVQAHGVVNDEAMNSTSGLYDTIDVPKEAFEDTAITLLSPTDSPLLDMLNASSRNVTFDWLEDDLHTMDCGDESCDGGCVNG